MDQDKLLEAFRAEARVTEGIDLAVYQDFGLDPTIPVIGEGDPRARLAIFGRDPGREEIRWRMPFIGAGGQKVRQGLYRAFHHQDLPDFEASQAIGAFVFWANTVPYKPIGNKAWSQKVKSRFKPLMQNILLNSWQGSEVLTLGREAFFWFGIGLPKQTRLELDAFWQRPDRFEASLEWKLGDSSKGGRVVRLHPLPHPSPLNATWFQKFPDLLLNRLQKLAFTRDTWRMP